ncbi:MAG TPA: hypothetical protein VEY10_19230 [Flavisolibacter sp.]|jgi:hypothetical protein|nr:hypothetical protein [Flavisolibacter sp.]
MKSKSKLFAFALFAIVLCLSQNNAAAQEMKDDMNKDMKMKKDGSKMKMSMSDMKNWPAASQMAAKDMMDKYGRPDEMTPTMLVWNNRGPWAKTVVYNKEYLHSFPMQHTDVMQQWVSYKVPTDKLNELAMYDGSVVVERTTGMISARCDKEGANFLALNLAHDIATGKRSVEDAREMYGKEVMKMKSGQMTEYTKGLMFSANLNAADADVALEKKNM